MASSRHAGRKDDYREPANRLSASASRGSNRDPGREPGREPPRDDRPRKEARSRRIPEDDSMDIDDDDDDDSDSYDGRPNGRSDRYPATSGGRSQPMMATTDRHRRDRSPDEQQPRKHKIVEAISEPRVKPGSDRDFWIPNEGIEREVIQYEITRYLGQDALVKPGKSDSGRNGYLISAFRAPTTEMIRSMKEASEKYLREKQSRSRPAAYSSSRTANDREQDLGRDRDRDRDRERDRERDRDRDLREREQREQPRHRDRARGYDSDDMDMDDAPPIPRGYERDYDRRDPEPRRGDRHIRDQRDIDPRQGLDPRYQDLRGQDPRLPDPRYQPDSRYQQDPRAPESRIPDPRMMQQEPRYPDPRDSRYPDPRDLSMPPARHHPYTSTYVDPSVAAYTLSPSSQPPGFDYTSAQPRTTFSNNTPPPTSRAGQPVYLSGYPPVSQSTQVVQDPRSGRLVQVAGGYVQEPPRTTRHR